MTFEKFEISCRISQVPSRLMLLLRRVKFDPQALSKQKNKMAELGNLLGSGALVDVT